MLYKHMKDDVWDKGQRMRRKALDLYRKDKLGNPMINFLMVRVPQWYWELTTVSPNQKAEQTT